MFLEERFSRNPEAEKHNGKFVLNFRAAPGFQEYDNFFVMQNSSFSALEYACSCLPICRVDLPNWTESTIGDILTFSLRVRHYLAATSMYDLGIVFVAQRQT